MRLLAAFVLLVVATSARADPPTTPGSDQPIAAETIQGRADSESRLTVPVRIAGRGPYDFVVDTGAQRSLIAASVAAKLALPPSANLHIVDIGGRQEVTTALAEEIGIGRRTYRNLVMPVLEDKNLVAQGVIGTDNMQGQRVLFDFGRNRLQIGDAKSLGGNAGYEIVVTAKRKSGQLIITEAVMDGVRVHVVIDTGAETSIGNRALQRALQRRRKTTSVTLLSVTGIEVPADLAPFERLSIGHVGITHPVVAFTDAPVFAALDLDRRPAMTVGMHELRLFRRVALDFASRKVLFDVPSGV